MDSTDLIVMLPVIIIGATAVLIMLSAAIRRGHRLAAFIAASGILAALGSLFAASSLLPARVGDLFIFDPYAMIYTGLILCGAMATMIFSYDHLEGRGGAKEEFYILILLAVFGALVLVVSSHFVSFFLGLEILSVSLYTLISYGGRGNGIEAGTKYLVLASVSSAFLLFGMALIYYDAGTMELSWTALLMNMSNMKDPMTTVANREGIDGILLFAGAAMVLTGTGFKLALVPFHMWTPDVYEGAPTPVAAFVATVSKGAVFAFLLRYFGNMGITDGTPLFAVFSVIAVLSMIAGNLLALFQNNVKRILAYSSISHLGYVLAAFLAGGPLAITAVTFYLVAYFVTMLGAFGTVSVVCDTNGNAGDIDDFRGLAWDRPWLAGVFTVMIFSLAGIPLTAGFIAKFDVLYADIKSGLWLLAIALAITSVAGLFYYLRIIMAVFERRGISEYKTTPVPVASAVTLIVLALLAIFLGVWPGPVMQMIADLSVMN